jgi:Ni,Fe-hydrogenase maturation factor
MTTNYLKLAVMAIIAGVMVTACGSSSKVAKTPEQKASLSRGVKQDKEECEQAALQESKGWRASGNGVSPNENFAHSIAELNAKAQLARQLEEQINSKSRVFNQQYNVDKAQDLVDKNTLVNESEVNKLLTNVKPICSNTYVKQDGSFNVYVCVEMGEENLSRIYKKLSDDKKLSIDFAESQFIKEMQKAKEEYRSRGE